MYFHEKSDGVVIVSTLIFGLSVSLITAPVSLDELDADELLCGLTSALAFLGSFLVNRFGEDPSSLNSESKIVISNNTSGANKLVELCYIIILSTPFTLTFICSLTGASHGGTATAICCFPVSCTIVLV